MPFPSVPLACIPLLLILARVSAECKIHLPVVSTGATPDPAPVIDPSETRRHHLRRHRHRNRHPHASHPFSERVLAGVKASETDFDNIVVFELESQPGQFTSNCAGSLISPSWVITSAQCTVTRGSTVRFQAVSNAGSGESYAAVSTLRHPDSLVSSQLERGDLMLVKLDRPVATSTPSPAPSNVPAPDAPTQTTIPEPATRQGDGSDSNPDQEDDNDSPPSSHTPSPPPFNLMRLNNNTDFAQDPKAPRFLRVKGFGLTTRPNQGQEPLTGANRRLLFADLQTSKCGDNFGNDGKRRLCTKPDNNCGPCYGDTGAPLYDVDKSGKVSVLVGIVTFGVSGISNGDAERTCTNGDRPTIYTAVAPYITWIRENVDEELTEFFIPKEGITNTNLDPGKPGLSVAARLSIIVIASLALIGFITFLLVTCTLRRLRHRRKQWVEGLHAEESFVKGDEKHAGIADPFEGIVEDRKTPRLSVNSLSRAAVKSATEFSARSIGTIRALLMHIEEEEMHVEPREPIEDAPQWLPDAWEKLFRAPSKQEVDQIHKIKTQRVVDDVLEGGDKSVEPSLESVAFKSARDEANLEAAWRKLEIQTSLRNLSETSGSKDGLNSNPGTIPSTRNNSGRLMSRHSSQSGTHGALSSLLAGNVAASPSLRAGARRAGGAGDAKPETLLAAFASIDAESEQVAEETVIDQMALQALASSKRPKVLETLRRKFSGGAFLGALGNKNADAGPSSPRVKLTSRKAITAGVGGHGGSQHGSVGRVGSGPAQTITALANRSSRQVGRGASLRNGSAGSVDGLSADMNGHGSMHVDYFSEDYSFSSSSDEDQPGRYAFDLESASRRFTEDRRDDIASPRSHRGFRKTKPRSFEKLDSRWIEEAEKDDEFEGHLKVTAAGAGVESVIAEGTPVDIGKSDSLQDNTKPSVSTLMSSEDSSRRATDGLTSTSENDDEGSVLAMYSLDGISEDTVGRAQVEDAKLTRILRADAATQPVTVGADMSAAIQRSELTDSTGRLEVTMEQDHPRAMRPGLRVDEVDKVSFEEMKAMWNEKARRDSQT